MRLIQDVARDFGLRDEELLPVGRHKAKIDPAVLDRPADGKGRVVLVSAITPTKAGEGKTTTSVGLAMGMRRIGRRVALCLREPSLGPCFGIKGGGTGGGAAQVLPPDDINLHFTGDIHAITAAHNLLAAMVDNDLHFGARSGLDPRRVTWSRALDVNDRSLRQVNIGLGGKNGGVPRETRFDITAASEIMAVLCLANSLDDLRERLGRIVVGSTGKRQPVTAADLGAAEALTALLRDAIKPNLVQTSEGHPALVHGGPFANIAHGCSSVLATRVGMHLCDDVITEAGFGFELGGEKFLDIKCRAAGIFPRAVVMVVTVRALEQHGGGDLERGFEHLARQLGNVRAFGVPPVVAINVFGNEGDGQLDAIEAFCRSQEVAVGRSTGFRDGGAGAEDLARVVGEVVDASDASPPAPKHLYALEDSYPDKLRAVARTIYGADDIELSDDAASGLKRIVKDGYANLPVCIAKTHLSLSDDPKAGGMPQGFTVKVTDVRLSAGAGFVVALMGDIMTMPGLPKVPAAARVRVEPDGRILGLMQGE